MAAQLNIKNVQFEQADLHNLVYEDETFDIIIVCFVLEHLKNPIHILGELKGVLKKGGTMVAIEGDHGSTFFYPDSAEAHQAIDCQVKLQSQNGGNSNIGRELYPLFQSVGLDNTYISSRMVYVDAGRHNLVEGFIQDDRARRSFQLYFFQGLRYKNLTYEKSHEPLTTAC
jgi:SAM-dependent methyltransferase